METTAAPKTDMTVANTILQQLGGMRRLTQMVGAKDFIGDANSVTFKFMKGKDGINAVTINLDSSDTYSLSFFKLRGINCKTMCHISMVYNDQLKNVFERTTSLAIRL